jgi:CelD/BcsL family acetyltransferase involved in cellulose biosynthesis
MQHGYSIRLSQNDWDVPEVRSAWTRLIDQGSEVGRLEGSPEFLDHLRSTQDPSRLYLAIVRDSGGSICGIIPFSIATSILYLSISRFVLPALRILGSVPLLPANSVVHDLLFTVLAEEFGGCQVISMSSVPTEGYLWNHVRESKLLNKNFIPYVMYGVRSCHIIPIPSSAEAYFASFSAKRRYNIKRQRRILGEHFAGQLHLRCFESPNEMREFTKLIRPNGEFGGLRRWGREGILRINLREAESLAERGLLLNYLLLGDGRPCAAIVGLKYQGVYHVNRIPRDRSLDQFSPGTTVIDMVIEHLIKNSDIRKIDMGFGSPAYPHSATNLIEPRASVLLFRNTLTNRFRRLTHASLDSLMDFCKAKLGTLSHGARLRTHLAAQSHSSFGRKIKCRVEAPET